MSKTYRIETLSDIFALPDADAMQRCLDELAIVMPKARALGDLCGHLAGEPCFRFDGHIDWTDDDKGELGVLVSDGSGGELLRMEIQTNPESEAK